MPLITVVKRSCEKEFGEEGQHSGRQKAPVSLTGRTAAVIPRELEAGTP